VVNFDIEKPMSAHNLAAVTVLGSTGSIGMSTLDVVRRHPNRYQVIGLTAAQKVDELIVQCLEFKPLQVALANPASAAEFRQKALTHSELSKIQVLEGEHGLCEVAAATSGQFSQHKVMAAIVGGAGLAPTLAAARQGKQILLANKEAIVMAGHLFLSTCEAHNAQILPIDSEHNAVFQCLPAAAALRQVGAEVLSARYGIASIVLTASGGPFRTFSLAQMAKVTPDQACAHPKWQMGRKISVDSATMMNKGLELIEAHHLFNLPAEQLEVVFHPQSVIHSLVTYCDGSVLAELGNPDMRTPIAHALAYPERISSGVAPLNLVEIAKLEFEAPDEHRFPCLRLAREALKIGGNAACVLNAANEIAVAAFLDKRIGFCDIAKMNEVVMNGLGNSRPLMSLDEVFAIDQEARAKALASLAAFSNP
jgi:1-deoxy-D-xylulose-5-phosphate reductoisomerase